MADLNQDQQRRAGTRPIYAHGGGFRQCGDADARRGSGNSGWNGRGEEKRLRGRSRKRHGSAGAGVRAACPLDYRPRLDAGDARRGAANGTRRKCSNVAFALGNAVEIPFPDESLDLALSSYALHHVPEPGRVIGEMSRVLKRGGRAGIIDIFVQEDRRSAEMHDRIERVRDPSHVRTLAQSEFESLFAANELRVTGTHVEEHPADVRSMDANAGREPSDPEYVETRRLMEATIPDDLAGFHPRYSATSAADSGEVPGIEMVNSVVFFSAEKIA